MVSGRYKRESRPATQQEIEIYFNFFRRFVDIDKVKQERHSSLRAYSAQNPQVPIKMLSPEEALEVAREYGLLDCGRARDKEGRLIYYVPHPPAEAINSLEELTQEQQEAIIYHARLALSIHCEEALRYTDFDIKF